MNDLRWLMHVAILMVITKIKHAKLCSHVYAFSVGLMWQACWTFSHSWCKQQTLVQPQALWCQYVCHSQRVCLADADAQLLFRGQALVLPVLAESKVLQGLAQQLRRRHSLIVDVRAAVSGRAGWNRSSELKCCTLR